MATSRLCSASSSATFALSISSLAILAAASLLACGDSGDSGTTSASTASAGGATPITSATGGAGGAPITASSTGSSEGGAAPQCKDVYVESACGSCLEQNCCSTLAACGADKDCPACVTYDYGDSPGKTGATKSLVDSLTSCAMKQCESTCFATPRTPACDATDPGPSKGSCSASSDGICNPMTNEGCSGKQICDVDSTGAYNCFDPVDDQPVCEGCSTAGPGSCAPGYTCIITSALSETPNPWTYQAQCAAFCCADGDCGSGTCDKTALPSSAVGVCLW